MRLRRKAWIGEAIKEYSDLVILLQSGNAYQGRWREILGRDAPLHVELGTGRGTFITDLAALHRSTNFIGMEAVPDVLYNAAQKAQFRELNNLKLLLADVNNILDIFAPGEVNRLYINFCDPWPKRRHAKRRLTHAGFLAKYKVILALGGELFFKTDNIKLFEFSLNQFADMGLSLGNITFDLHNSSYEGNIMTEYEAKFSALGQPIYRCEVRF
ncbi:s-adenosyl-l-methionine-dependent methyltransferase [Lucifera butyrica]|uniref:tRNA (guanine-N(7)-)-methyltransferase n=1 Tax=Lucifera butyrica TaxID=1351585 RepID=A0A498R281_9FIRM|nr:tRNA (guanosine(46)-N7)-methyltransferase TrmB [Lucifera butyrica]VBB05265.1 s-adenosyl-l-methionine-dependent methyltransferase [Lucifera butyrica]